jgi:hypothetical protein
MNPRKSIAHVTVILLHVSKSHLHLDVAGHYIPRLPFKKKFMFNMLTNLTEVANEILYVNWLGLCNCWQSLET